ncbi:MAG: DDE-type integrase/transposase/recombinase [Candidatus Acidiferrum sp.]
MCVIDCCTREIVGWNLSHRCWTENALAALEQAMLERVPSGSREENVTLTTDNGTQFTLRASWKRWGGSALHIAAPPTIIRKATATSNDSIAA